MLLFHQLWFVAVVAVVVVAADVVIVAVAADVVVVALVVAGSRFSSKNAVLPET